MTGSKWNGTGLSPQSGFEWRYEYYYDEEPVSFEGLRNYRYSIVVSFWVGLAVFVIFMFFVLTLLTKTGAPHPEGGEGGERRACPSHIIDLAGPQRPLLDSHFQCNVQEGEEPRRGGGAPGAHNDSLEEEDEEEENLQGEPRARGRGSEAGEPFLPNAVMSEHTDRRQGNPRVTD